MTIGFKVTGLVLVGALAGCATAPNGQYLQQQVNSGAEPCNALAASVGGAILGALLGGSKNRAAGAVAGGAIGAAACLAVNYRATQVKSAQQVNQEFQRTNGGLLPDHATVVRFDSRFDPTNTVRPGGSSNLVSYIEVAQGRDGVQPNIEEEVTLFGPDGTQLKRVRKAASSGGTAGAFQTQFSFAMPQGIPQGVYPFKTALYLNGQMVKDGQAQLQVVSISGDTFLATR